MVRGKASVAVVAAALIASCTAALGADVAAEGMPEVPAAVLATEYDWFVHVGPAGVLFDEGASVSAGGAGVSGEVAIDDDLALGLDIGWYVMPDVSLSLTLANAPLASVAGDGGVTGTLGTLGKVNYLPPVLAVQYHLPQFGMVRPYIGGGVNYTMFFNEKDGALSDFDVDNAFGAVVQAGAR
ncbi:Outer membrane protein W precursor [Methylobrevis pamukkalensis]|uniref:Outer membrane protein W n=1 Tax=Methylobrevis pamukkalensis TaxID=1439726 RepID=A0A1E3H6Z4_9HYPH|nr:OmpW family outer membrane protein [Methylobrevis pamukkalensis]ODN72109.1 Outer membrane protein W precursor [Methylobrevis pamukkalensis]